MIPPSLSVRCEEGIRRMAQAYRNATPRGIDQLRMGYRRREKFEFEFEIAVQGGAHSNAALAASSARVRAYGVNV